MVLLSDAGIYPVSRSPGILQVQNNIHYTDIALVIFKKVRSDIH